MCGRFTQHYTWREIHDLYRLTAPSSPTNLRPRYNICPTTTIDAVVDHQLIPMRWGLISGWWGKPLKEMRLATFNARAETVAEKPMFRAAFKTKRCLIPVSGYYEWQTTPGGKQPYYFTRRDGQVITIAGIWDEWTSKETGKAIKSCSMLITSPNRFAAEVHDRMPVILELKDFEQWERGDLRNAAALMKPAGEKVLQKWPVSKRVNNSRTSDEDTTLILPV